MTHQLGTILLLVMCCVVQRHHVAQTLCILNTDGCNVFHGLSKNDYSRALDYIRDIILATDLAHHLRILKQLQDLAHSALYSLSTVLELHFTALTRTHMAWLNVMAGGDTDAMRADEFDASNAASRKLLLCLLMTSADLSDQTKGWRNTKRTADLIYREFFTQGDLERALGQQPTEMMDRERACIPDLQVGFLDGIALPLYGLLADVVARFPNPDGDTDAARRRDGAAAARRIVDRIQYKFAYSILLIKLY